MGEVRFYRNGEGADSEWCFVRLPASYGRSSAPHPFVICNHGNGWTMDGSERTANFTAKTQYGVDRQRGGFYMSGLADGYRLYSNPLIEALLEEGFIVCGAQNGGDQLYGNERSRQACAAFYRHMRATYRVTECCCMLGASNGFMTTLNSVAFFGPEAVSAIVGLYPLCNLRHAFRHTHRAQVKQAYGIVTDEDTEFGEKTMGSDRDWRGWSIEPERRPPALLIWSTQDRVLPMAEHAVKWGELYQVRGSVAELIRVDGQEGQTAREVRRVQVVQAGHGDWRHFRQDDIVHWFKTKGG